MINHSGRTYLEVGDRFYMHPSTGQTGIFECSRVTPGSATIRSETRTATDFTAKRGHEEETDVAFDKPGRRFTVCPAPLGITMVGE